MGSFGHFPAHFLLHHKARFPEQLDLFLQADRDTLLKSVGQLPALSHGQASLVPEPGFIDQDCKRLIGRDIG